MKLLRLLTTLSIVLAATPVLAADPVYPPGLRIGLTPMVGLVAATTFPGFESTDRSVKVLLTELPAGAYGEVANAMKANPSSLGALKPESLQTEAGLAYYTAESAKDAGGNVRRYSMIVAGGSFSGYVAVQIPENATRIYSDDAVRQMFTTVALRKKVPVEEQLSLLPFRMNELANFKNVYTLAPGAALVLADNDESAGFEPAPFMVIGLIGGTAPQPDERAKFAQQAATTIPGVREARITMSEPIRIDGQAAYETRIDATSGKDNTPVTIVQWLRFGGPSVMRIIGSAPRDQWSSAFPRFREVRDGIKPRG